MKENAQQIQIESRQEWRDWLAQNHAQTEGVWLVRFKKHRADKYVSYDEAVEEALCVGWIDSLPRKLDEDRTMLWMAPRKPKSNWSKLNKERVEKMLSQGLMTPAGLEKIEDAKRDGSWQALDKIENLEIPSDLQTALAGYANSSANFEAFSRSVKRGILEWISNAKRPATRSKRIEETARLAQDNIRANQWRKK
ncbi:MAG: YdeI/OmpD-associated family protein [Chloroflexota bacterium]